MNNQNNTELVLCNVHEVGHLAATVDILTAALETIRDTGSSDQKQFINMVLQSVVAVDPSKKESNT